MPHEIVDCDNDEHLAALHEGADNMSDALSLLVGRDPFIAADLMSHRIIGDVHPPAGMPPGWPWTACTNGVEIRYNPYFINSLIREHRIFIEAHEEYHILFLHAIRMGSRDPQTWNEACDYQINLMLVQRGFKLPPGVLINNRFSNLSAEAIYDILKREEEADAQTPQPAEGPEEGDQGEGEGDPPEVPVRGADEGQQEDQEECDTGSGEGDGEESGSEVDDREGADGGGEGEGEGDGGGVETDFSSIDWSKVGAVRPLLNDDGSPLTEEQKAEFEADRMVQEKMNEIIEEQLTDRGVVAGGGARELARAKQPSRDIVDVLEQYVDHSVNEDYTYERPNRAYFNHPIIMPSLEGEGFAELFIWVDTSISVTPRDIEVAAGLVQRIIDNYPGIEVTVGYCDAAVYPGKMETFRNGDPEVVLTPCGGGGTAFTPVFEWMENHYDGQTPTVLVYITDGCGDQHMLARTREPEYPVLWAVSDQQGMESMQRCQLWGEYFGYE